MTEPKSLTALADEMRGAVSAGVIQQHSAEVEIIQWADTIYEYLAARPASDLERRLRERCEQYRKEFGQQWSGSQDEALLLEAAAVLAFCACGLAEAEAVQIRDARIAELERERDMLGNMCASYEEKFKLQREKLDDLERELAEAREVHGHERHQLLQTALGYKQARRATEARLAAVALVLHVNRLLIAETARQALAQALAAPAQEPTLPSVHGYLPAARGKI